MPARWIVLALLACACAPAPAERDASRGEDASVPALRAAARSVDITPEPGAIIVGFGSRESTEGRDPLQASVLVVRDGARVVALVTLDLPGIFEWHASQIRTLVSSRTGAAYDDVIVAASHTHSAPMLGDDAWSRDVVDAIGRAAAEAASELEPVSATYGEDRIGFDVNRRLVVDGVALSRPNPSGPHDPRVRVIALEHGGAPRAIVAHAVCHANVLRGVESTRISADFPGEARRALAELGAPVLFANGSAGDVRPNRVDDAGEFRVGGDADLVELGAELAEATRRAMQDARTLPASPIASAHATLFVPRVDGGERAIELGAIRIGPIVLLTIPGEPFVEIGLAIEERLAETLGDDAIAIVLGYANGYADYIVTEDAARYGGYEVERAILAPSASIAIEDTLVELATSLY